MENENKLTSKLQTTISDKEYKQYLGKVLEEKLKPMRENNEKARKLEKKKDVLSKVCIATASIMVYILISNLF